MKSHKNKTIKKRENKTKKRKENKTKKRKENKTKKTKESFNNYHRLLTFSNTQHWKPRYYKSTINMPDLQKSILHEIKLPYIKKEELYDKTPGEIDDLLKKQDMRTHKTCSITLHQRTLSGILDYYKLSNPEDRKYMKHMNEFLLPIIFSIKKMYNRVRPSYFDKRIKPCIEVPGHPSFPSGHATQAFLFAYILSHKYPSKRDFLMRTANDIAVNRERVGVHYKSDTLLGKDIAKQLFHILKKRGLLMKN